MTTEPEKVWHERMAANPFAPVDAGPDARHAHAVEYIAFYLREIDQKIERIAKALEELQISGSTSTATLISIRAALAHRT